MLPINMRKGKEWSSYHLVALWPLGIIGRCRPSEFCKLNSFLAVNLIQFLSVLYFILSLRRKYLFVYWKRKECRDLFTSGVGTWIQWNAMVFWAKTSMESKQKNVECVYRELGSGLVWIFFPKELWAPHSGIELGFQNCIG